MCRPLEWEALRAALWSSPVYDVEAPTVLRLQRGFRRIAQVAQGAAPAAAAREETAAAVAAAAAARSAVVIDGKEVGNVGPWTVRRGAALGLANQLLRQNQLPEGRRRVALVELAARGTGYSKTKKYKKAIPDLISPEEDVRQKAYAAVMKLKEAEFAKAMKAATAKAKADAKAAGGLEYMVAVEEAVVRAEAVRHCLFLVFTLPSWLKHRLSLRTCRTRRSSSASTSSSLSLGR